MKHLAGLCLALTTTTAAAAQQALYAGNAWGDLIEVVGYDSSATLRTVQATGVGGRRPGGDAVSFFQAPLPRGAPPILDGGRRVS